MWKILFFAVACFSLSGGVQSQDVQTAQRVVANQAEVTWLDRLAAARDLVFDPSRIPSYWPEYLYEFDQIVDSRVCQTNQEDGNTVLGIDLDRVREMGLGEIALVWPFTADNSTHTESQNYRADYYTGIHISDVANLWSSRLESEMPVTPQSNASDLSVEELCTLLGQEDILGLVNELLESGDSTPPSSEVRIVMSEVFPDSDISFEHHVRVSDVIPPDPSTQLPTVQFRVD